VTAIGRSGPLAAKKCGSGPLAAIGLALAILLPACTSAPDDDGPVQVIANPTATDIWVAEILDSGRRLRIGTPVNVTDRQGYDNQPHFLFDASGFLYSSIDDSGQVDVHRYLFDRERSVQVTDTREAEFSPTPHPDRGFSAVRVERDGRQRLWRFDDDGDDRELLFADVGQVGYHAWVDPYRAALFVLGDPPTLQLAYLRTGEVELLLSSIGRAVHAVPGRDAVSVVHKVSEDEWNIVEVAADGGVQLLAEALRPGEDYAWTPDGQLVMGRGSKLYIRRPGEGFEWQELADFAEHGVKQITRIAVSPANDRIAFVAQR
jgi:hypothetical protein